MSPSASTFRAERIKRAEDVIVQMRRLLAAISSSFKISTPSGEVLVPVQVMIFSTLLVSNPHSHAVICSVVVSKGSVARSAMAFV